MGFSRREARAAVDTAVARLGPSAPREPLLRAALRAAT